MESGEVIETIHDTLFTLLLLGAPVMGAALLVGLIIALLQALTQIQEATLTFVPKIVAMLLVLALTLPWMFSTLADFTTRIQDRIVNIE